MSKIEACPVCRSVHLQDYSRWNSRQEHRRFVKCAGCGHLFAADFSPSELDRAYREDYYPTPDDPRIQNWIDQNKEVWAETVADILRFRKNFSSILDYGAGTGGFLERFNEMTGRNTEIYAVENASAAKENLQNRFPSAKVFSSVDECEKRDFDCIAVLQCFEHLDDPLEICKDLRSRLSKGGIMIVTVPNRYSYRTILRGRNDHYNPGNTTHLQFFSSSTMFLMLKNSGFCRIYRMKNCPVSGSIFRKLGMFLLRKLGLSSELRFICIADE